MNIALPARWKKFVRARIASGQYADEGSLMTEALRLLEFRDEQIQQLRQEIEAGRRSGKPRPFDPEAIKRRGRARIAEGLRTNS